MGSREHGSVEALKAPNLRGCETLAAWDGIAARIQQLEDSDTLTTHHLTCDAAG